MDPSEKDKTYNIRKQQTGFELFSVAEHFFFIKLLSC